MVLVTCDNLNMGEAYSTTVINALNGDLSDENITSYCAKTIMKHLHLNWSTNVLITMNQINYIVSITYFVLRFYERLFKTCNIITHVINRARTWAVPFEGRSWHGLLA